MALNLDDFSTTVSRDIHPDCEMFKYALTQIKDREITVDYYLNGGKSLAQHLSDLAFELGWDPKQKTILDFASGYGRVTRWLPFIFKETTCSDLSVEMLIFDRARFGVRAFLSSEKPEDFRPPSKYDVVFCFSLFTHLNQKLWSRWFGALTNTVADGGIFVFSAHSYELMERLTPGRLKRNQARGDEFVFWASNETSGRLDRHEYGGNVVTPSYVMEVGRGYPTMEFYKRYKMGEFDEYHDMYVFRRTGGSPQASL